jgi:hypothetical protein
LDCLPALRGEAEAGKVTGQLSLFDDPPDDDGLVCAFGEPWMGPHPRCQAETDRLCAEFDAAVARGEYSPTGHKLTRKGHR